MLTVLSMRDTVRSQASQSASSEAPAPLHSEKPAEVVWHLVGMPTPHVRPF